MSLSLVLQTVIVLYMLLSEGFHYRRKMAHLNETADADPGARARFYRSYMMREWGFVAAIGTVLALGQNSPAAIGLRWGSFVDTEAIYGMAWAAGMFLLLPLLVAQFFPSVRHWLTEQMQVLGKLLPASQRDRQLWALSSVTGGITEEIRFRGFLPFYLLSLGPVLPAGVAIFLSGVLYGLAHWYQGWRGVLRNAGAGGFLGMMALSGGSLYPVILMHVLMELRPLAVLRILEPAQD
jgi:membrane protease YdiL (CAAX protease family)